MTTLRSHPVRRISVESLGDAHLAERVRRGDDEALGTLFDRHAGAVYHLAYRLLGSRDDAEDAVQDVFVGLRLALARYDERGSFGAWLKRVAARTALMRLRSARTRAMREAQAFRDDPEESTSDDRVDRAIASLPPDVRAVVVLKALEGYSHTEIGGLLGISTSASKVRFHRAVRRLKRLLEEPE